MGWFSFGGSSAPADDDNPTTGLDPSLKKFLDEESPKPYTTAAAPATDSNADNSSSAGSRDAASTGADGDASGAGIPSASLFPDGRYAHLWKTYKPIYPDQPQPQPPRQQQQQQQQHHQKQTEADAETPSNTLTTHEPSNAERVIEHFKRRKEALNDAALENCAEEHEALSLCFKTGGLGDRVWSRVTLCKAQNEQFARCYTMQTKFLQALGYASAFAPDGDAKERIQMHADTLFHKMLDYEKCAEEARAKNQPVPEPTSLFKPKETAATAPVPTPTEPATGDDTNIPVPGGDTLPPGAQWSKPPEQLTPHEREVEVRIAQQQMEMRMKYRGHVEDVVVEEDVARRLRQEKFSKWFGPTVGRWLA